MSHDEYNAVLLEVRALLDACKKDHEEVEKRFQRIDDYINKIVEIKQAIRQDKEDTNNANPF